MDLLGANLEAAQQQRKRGFSQTVKRIKLKKNLDKKITEQSDDSEKLQHSELGRKIDELELKNKKSSGAGGNRQEEAVKDSKANLLKKQNSVLQKEIKKYKQEQMKKQIREVIKM